MGAATAEISDFDSLSQSLMNRHQSGGQETEPEAVETPVEAPVQSQSKKFIFKKGENQFEVDEDAELEFMADKKQVRLQLKELKDRAAGDIAIKNRMHSLAEDKKRVQGIIKKYAEMAKTDPIGAMEYMSNQVKEVDDTWEHNVFLGALAEQAEKLGSMSEHERKAWELEKKLNKANEDLSLKETQKAIADKKQAILSEYPEIGDQKFGQMVDAVLENEELMSECESELDVMSMTERLIQETVLQAEIADCIQEIDPALSSDNELIFAIRDQVMANPDLDSEDVKDIIRDVVGQNVEKEAKKEISKSEVQKTLSRKMRSASPVSSLKTRNLSDFDTLMMKLEERKENSKKSKR